jgi:signal transduction histidine kinase
MTQTQVALSKTRSSAEYREVLESNCEEFERLSRMISDMLFLAKSENGLIVPGRKPLIWRTRSRPVRFLWCPGRRKRRHATA